MLTGYNSEVRYKGLVYHIQTQDKGRNNPKIETTVYRKGAVQDTRRISYEDILPSDCLEEVVAELMKELHEKTVEDIKSGFFSDGEDTGVFRLKRETRKKLEKVIVQYLNQNG